MRQRYEKNFTGSIEFDSIHAKPSTSEFIKLEESNGEGDMFDDLQYIQALFPSSQTNMCITVVGNDHLLDRSCTHVIKSALQATKRFGNACIITSGLNQTAVRMLGEAICEIEQVFPQTETQIRCLGITPWHPLSKETWYNIPKGNTIRYTVTRSKRRDETTLSINPFQNKIIFVDGKPDQVQRFRCDFEKKIVEQANIPVVLLVIGGDQGVLRHALTSMSNRISLLICSGTGGAADVLHKAYDIQQQSNDEEEFIIKLKKTWADEDLRMFYRIQRNQNIITIYDVYKYEDIGLAVCQAALKQCSDWRTKFKLAYLLDDVKIGREIIRHVHQSMPIDEPNSYKVFLKGMIRQSLEEEKFYFFDLITQYVLFVEEFSPEFVRELYEKGSCLSSLPPHLQRFPLKEGEPSSWMKCLKPYQELFVWAVSHQRQKAACHFWKRCENPLVMALIACNIYMEMCNSTSCMESSVIQRCKDYKEEFQSLATDLVNEAHRRDKEKCASLIRSEAYLWENFDSMGLAYESQCGDVVCTAACQNLLNNVWNRGTAYNCEQLQKPERDDVESQTNEKKCNTFRNIIKQIQTPKANYALYSANYIVFLLMFSYILLLEVHQNHIGVVETIVYCYFISFAVEDIAQIFLIPKRGYKKLIFWRKYHKWGKLYLITAVFAVTIIMLRLTGQSQSVTLPFYSVTLILCYIRLFRIYFVSTHLGPKLLIFWLMLKDSLLFFAIMGPSVILCGVLLQSLLHADRKSLDITVLPNLVYHPYYAIFGELDLSYIHPPKNCTIDPDPDRCQTLKYLVGITYPVYQFVASVVFLNLLIAIFNTVYSRVADNSSKVWVYGTYAMVVEYIVHPRLPAPFSAIEILYIFMKYVFQRIKGETGSHRYQSLQSHEEDVFEDDCRNAVLDRKRKHENNPK